MLKRSEYEQLHRLLVETMTKRLQDGEVTAAELNVIRQLLKDSGMDFVEKNYEQLKELAVPFPTASDLVAEAEVLKFR